VTFLLPRTSVSRTDHGFLRLLTDVDVLAPPGLQFKGRLLTPGAKFDPASLPRPAVVLECAGSVRISEGQSRYCFRHLWLLWRYDFERLEWVEVVREISDSAEWTLHFAPIAQRLLNSDQHELLQRQTARAEIERLADFLTAALDELNRELCCFVVAGLDIYVAQQVVNRSGPYGLQRNF
jgi:hypothetical protein